MSFAGPTSYAIGVDIGTPAGRFVAIQHRAAAAGAS
jgi:hypothetical protein